MYLIKQLHTTLVKSFAVSRCYKREFSHPHLSQPPPPPPPAFPPPPSLRLSNRCHFLRLLKLFSDRFRNSQLRLSSFSTWPACSMRLSFQRQLFSGVHVSASVVNKLVTARDLGETLQRHRQVDLEFRAHHLRTWDMMLSH